MDAQTRTGRVFERALQGISLACWAAMVQALVLAAFRIAFLLRHAGPDTRLPPADVARALLMGARLDLKVGAVAALPLVLLGALPGRAARRGARAWAAASAFALALLAVVNDGYFAFFHTPIDLTVFGLFEDDTAAVLCSLWAEHHVLAGLAAAAGLGAAQAWLLARARPPRAPAAARPALAVLGVALLFLAVRGRVGGAPLGQRDFPVSAQAFLNAAVPNGPFALQVAVTDRAKVRIGDDPYVALRAAGFRRPADAAAALGLAPAGASDAEVAAALFTRSRENPYAAAHPPHVVLVMMESWGADVLRHHSARNDLLGRLAPHLARGLLFRRFVSGFWSTDATLEALLVRTPFVPVLPGAPGAVPFEQAAVLPFREAGYRTVFGMGWSSTWRGVGRSFPHQGFDEVADVSAISAAEPDAPVGTWGVPDGALFGWALGRLQQADARGERLLLVLMTSTNHTPFGVPPGYALRPIAPEALSGRRLAEGAVLRPQLETYQYACDALGGFLDAIQAGPLGERTIVAATGDHNTRDLFAYAGTEDLPWRDRVPFLLEAPPAYLAGRPAPDLDRWAGHRDVFPTLAALALSGARVYRWGEDLLAPPRRPPRALGRFEAVFSDAGVTPVLGDPAALCWDGERPAAAPGGACAPAVGAIAAEELAHRALLDWNVRRQAIARARRSGTLAAVQR